MLLHTRTFEDPGSGLDIGSEASCPNPPVEPEQPATVSAMVSIAPQIEAEIPFLRRMVRRWHREAADADDLVQDTLLRALANAHLWQPGSNLQAWLATIMRNQFLATVARAQRSEAVAEIIDLANHCASEDVGARLTLRDVERAFRRLPVKQRLAVLHAGIEGKSYGEVAGLMGVSVDAVRCHLARARGQLRAAVYQQDETTWLQYSSPQRRGREPPPAGGQHAKAVPVQVEPA